MLRWVLAFVCSGKQFASVVCVCVFLFQGVGAVASRRAAELYGLDILEENINDAKDNVTRFIKLAR